MTDTPETDKALFAVQHGGDAYSFPEHARKMERQRDEARAALRDAIQCLSDGHGWAKHLERWKSIAGASLPGSDKHERGYYAHELYRDKSGKIVPYPSAEVEKKGGE